MSDIEIPRYSTIPLPAFKYIPAKKNKEQISLKHSHIPEIPEQSITFSTNNWQNSERYLYAIDLFNYGYYWEVHEVLENIWLKIGKTSPTGLFIQGIIQLSVAFVKVIESNFRGAERMKVKALAKIQSENSIYLGIEIALLVNQFDSFINSEKCTPPYIILHF